MKRMLIFALLALAGALTGDPPTPPKLYVYYMPSGGSQWIWKPLNVDAPLSLSVDKTGQAHLTAGGIATVSQPAAVPKRDVFTTQGGTYTLSGTPSPAANIEVFYNGILQTPADYTVSGNTLTFNFAVDDRAPTIQVLYAQ